MRRVIDFSKRAGYDGMVMCNLFALISPYPGDLLKSDDPLGENDDVLEHWKGVCENVVFCWGSFAEARDRAAQVIEQFPTAYCLEQNQDGAPRHPLYVPSATTLKIYLKP